MEPPPTRAPRAAGHNPPNPETDNQARNTNKLNYSTEPITLVSHRGWRGGRPARLFGRALRYPAMFVQVR